MHIEIQVALNFVISYLYNKLPRRRVNIFGEELEKALKDKFQGHWYPEKPFKGSAFRCLKTGDPIDSVLERAARESGVPITDILENLPTELSVWVDPAEVSYRIGEKGAVKILYSENSENHEDSSLADREVNKTFNPEAQSFRPIDGVNSSMNSLSLSAKTSPNNGSSSTSPTYKGSPNPATGASSFMQRTQVPLTFTTATFAQTKFGSTKLKTSSKRANSSYRMSPTEFSNYIKQRAMQQQLHHSQSSVGSGGPQPNHFGLIGQVTPPRSLSPNPLTLGLGQNTDPFYFPNISGGISGMYPPQFNGHRNLFDSHFHPEASGLYANGAGVVPSAGAGAHSKFSAYMEPHGFFGLNNHVQTQQPNQQQQQQQSQPNAAGSIAGNLNKNNNGTDGGNSHANAIDVSTTIITATTSATNASIANCQQPIATVPPTVAVAAAAASSSSDSNSSKLIDGLNSFYSNATGPYQHLLVAN